MDKERLKIDFLGKTFENPYILAATPSTDEFDMLVDAFRAGWAGAILKTTAVDSQEVNLKYPMMHFIKDSAGRLMTMAAMPAPRTSSRIPAQAGFRSRS